MEEKRQMIESEHLLSIRRQCELLGLSRGSFYYEPVCESEENLKLMRLLDEQYLKTPYYGSRRMAAWLQGQGFCVGRKRVQGLMGKMGLVGLIPKRKPSYPRVESKIYPYLLEGLQIERPNQVWCSDITYVPM